MNDSYGARISGNTFRPSGGSVIVRSGPRYIATDDLCAICGGPLVRTVDGNSFSTDGFYESADLSLSVSSLHYRGTPYHYRCRPDDNPIVMMLERRNPKPHPLAALNFVEIEKALY